MNIKVIILVIINKNDDIEWLDNLTKIILRIKILQFMMETNIKIDRNICMLKEINRITTAPPFKSNTIMKYMTPRSIDFNFPKSFHGSLRNFSFSNSELDHLPSMITMHHGLASLVQKSSSSCSTVIKSINDEQHQLVLRCKILN